MRNYLSKLSLFVISLFALSFILSPHSYAASPDGLGPWADNVISFNQGLQKNGLPVAAVRSNPLAALGVAEGTNADGTFVSLGFAGKLTLGFVNGISNGVFVVESTNLPYPTETAKVEISNDGMHWSMAGNVSRSGRVYQPRNISCAHFVRISDTSNPASFTDATADGYDVDGVEAQGQTCSTGTGGGNTTVTVNNNSNCTILQATSSTIVNGVTVIQNTGGNNTSGNVGGGNNTNTGSTFSSTSIQSTGGSNFTTGCIMGNTNTNINVSNNH